MACLKSVFLFLAFLNVTFGQNAPVVDKEFEIKYFAKATWYNAHLSCLACGGQLASIESAAEQNYVEGLIRSLGNVIGQVDLTPKTQQQFCVDGIDNYCCVFHCLACGLQNDSFWLAGTDLANEGIWNWFTTGDLLTYSNFIEGYPNNVDNSEHCLHLWGGERKLKWNDSKCSNLYYFICENKPKCDPPKLGSV